MVSDKTAQIEQLLALCDQLETRIESLTQDNAALREALAASEQQGERLSALVDQNAEDLILIGNHWFKPSAVATITADQSGVMVNGNLIGMGQGSFYSDQMAAIASHINEINANKRAQTKR